MLQTGRALLPRGFGPEVMGERKVEFSNSVFARGVRFPAQISRQGIQ